MKYQKLNRKAMVAMYLGTLIRAIIMGAIFVVGLIFMPKDLEFLRVVNWILLGLVGLNLIIAPYFRYHRQKYIVDQERIEIVRGLIGFTREIVPIERIQNIELTKGPILRAFHLTDLSVITAGGRVKIGFLEDETAEGIADSLRDKINSNIRNNNQTNEQAGE